MLILSITKEDMYILELCDVVIGVYVSPSQAYTFQLVALLVILFHSVGLGCQVGKTVSHWT